MMRYIVKVNEGLIVCGRIRRHPDKTYDWEVWLEPVGFARPNTLAWPLRATWFNTIRHADEAAQALGLKDWRVQTIHVERGTIYTHGVVVS